MALHRQATFAALALLGLAGCHAGTNGTLASKGEAPLTKQNITVDKFIAGHNRNVAAIRSLRASPGIEVAQAATDKADAQSGHVNGQMAFERSKNFRLKLTAGIQSPVADIGSNDRGFWFWISGNKKDNAIYACDYENLEDSQLAASFQPDWIIEAMGLREITEREAATIDARPGDPKLGEAPGTMVLTQLRKDPRARDKVLTKETIFDVESGHISQHKLYVGPKKTLIARASVSQYTKVKLKSTEANPEGFEVLLPQIFRLEWIEEKFSMKVTMSGVSVNPAFQPEARAALFSEPSIKNASRIDLGRQGIAQAGGTAPSSKMYETRPQPRTGSIQLGQPDSSVNDVDNAYRRASNPLPPMPAPNSSDIRPDGFSSLGVVGDPIPQGGDMAPTGSAGSGRWLGRGSQ